MNGAATSYTQTGLTNGTTYYYRVCAMDAAGNVSTGVTASATPAGTNQAPVANAGPSQSTQTLISVTFNGSGSRDPDGTIASYSWNFGDGTTGTGVTAPHTYSRAGTYTVTLTVTDNLGATGSASTSATISNRPPVANAGPDQNATVGSSVNLNGSGSSDPDGSIASYAWNFGDGATASGVSVSHAYSAAGTYTATLTVSDNNGAVASDQAVITVTTASAGGAYRWAIRSGGSGAQAVPYASAVDSSGNVIVVGWFSGTVNFGGGPLTSAGSSNIFVAKYSSTGGHLWSQRFGDTYSSAARGVAVDASGNVVVVGTFSGTVNFGGGTLTASYGGAARYNDIFIAKLSSAGGYLWSQRFGDSMDDYAYSVAVDGSGNIVMVGSFRGTLSLGGQSFVSYNFGIDAFVAKYSPAGQHLWSQAFGLQGPDELNGVAVDRNGNVIVTGYFQYSVDFGGGPLVVNSANASNVLVAKYSPDGLHLWSKAVGAGVGYGVAADSSANVAVTGYVQGVVDFGGGATPDSGSMDSFVVKYSSAGGYAWSRRSAAASADEVYGIAMDASGNVLVAGTFQGTADFGAGPLTSAGSWDVFVAKYSAATGAALWSKGYGNTANDVGRAVAADAFGNAILSGQLQGPVNLGAGVVNNVGYTDMFILGLGP
jgi:PKD repeat protein